MLPVFVSLLATLRDSLRTRVGLYAEVLALRHQLLVLQRRKQKRRLQLSAFDRILWVWLSRIWPDWKSALRIVKPETVIAWHRRGFRLYWRWKSRPRHGRPPVTTEMRELIRRISTANPGWGAPRIHGELGKLGIKVSETTVAKYMVQHRHPPSQTWRTFLSNHVKELVSADFFVVPTATFRLLFVFVILSHDRRRPVHFAVTSHPTAEWTAQQLLQAFPWDTAPRFLLRDRDGNYGKVFRETALGIGIKEVLCAPRSPWQNAYAERLIGSIRRECLDHVIVFHEPGLRRVLRSYFEYYTHSRTHLSLAKDAPIPRSIQPPELGRVVDLSEVGGLHHRYERRAA
jgi:putative transposase